ncbi:MAG: hypothetical protein ACFFB3_22830, partial [Candidatus Hodarchaeota archaeon]
MQDGLVSKSSFSQTWVQISVPRNSIGTNPVSRRSHLHAVWDLLLIQIWAVFFVDLNRAKKLYYLFGTVAPAIGALL